MRILPLNHLVDFENLTQCLSLSYTINDNPPQVKVSFIPFVIIEKCKDTITNSIHLVKILHKAQECFR